MAGVAHVPGRGAADKPEKDRADRVEAARAMLI